MMVLSGQTEKKCTLGARLKMLCAFATAVFCLCCLAAINDPGRLGPVVRMPASKHLRMAGPEDMPEPIYNWNDDKRVWGIRKVADNSFLNPVFAEAGQLIIDAPALTATVLAEDVATKLTPSPLLAQDGATVPVLVAYAPEYVDALDAFGVPVRWKVPENILAGYSLPRPAPFTTAPGAMPDVAVDPKFARALAKMAPARNVGDYRQLVEGFARRFGLSTELVLAIIHSESNFRTHLVSNRSAMGLMQLLPSTASDEVHRFLYGKRGQVTYAQLCVPEININYGTAYLHILNSRYFANVRDNLVREACVIASYNMGPNRFLRLYGSNNVAAVNNINSMTPEQFHADLPRRLPVRETRYYVEKVKRMMRHYAGNN